jgi:N-acetylglucosaminyl-diphospho-decaprenol L-rhamnosyltransferase
MYATYLKASSLTVIIVCYHSDSVIHQCVQALDRAITAIPQDSRPHATLALVANSPEDNIDSVESTQCAIVKLQATTNPGFAPAVNMALAATSSSDFVLLLNPDAQLGADCLSILMQEAMETHAALVGPVLCDQSGKPNGTSERPFHTLRREFVTQFFGRRRRQPAYGKTADRTGEARCLTGACLLVDGPFLQEVNGLDVEVRMYLEDVMLCWQAHQAGRRVMLARNARCFHALGASSEGANFISSIGLYLTLLGARVCFVRRTSGRGSALLMRVLIGVGAMIRLACSREQQRRRHLGVLRWAIASGRPPEWNRGPVVKSE